MRQQMANDIQVEKGGENFICFFSSSFGALVLSLVLLFTLSLVLSSLARESTANRF